MAKLEDRKMLPIAVPSAFDVVKDIQNGKLEDILDVRIETISIPKEFLPQPEMWMPKLFNKIETAFAPKLGYDNSHNLALTLPLIREIKGDYKSKSMMVTVIAVDVTPVIKAEGIYD